MQMLLFLELLAPVSKYRLTLGSLLMRKMAFGLMARVRRRPCHLLSLAGCMEDGERGRRGGWGRGERRLREGGVCACVRVLLLEWWIAHAVVYMLVVGWLGVVCCGIMFCLFVCLLVWSVWSELACACMWVGVCVLLCCVCLFVCVCLCTHHHSHTHTYLGCALYFEVHWSVEGPAWAVLYIFLVEQLSKEKRTCYIHRSSRMQHL